MNQRIITRYCFALPNEACLILLGEHPWFAWDDFEARPRDGIVEDVILTRELSRACSIGIACKAEVQSSGCVLGKATDNVLDTIDRNTLTGAAIEVVSEWNLLVIFEGGAHWSYCPSRVNQCQE